jgi:hypothetical protein
LPIRARLPSSISTSMIRSSALAGRISVIESSRILSSGAVQRPRTDAVTSRLAAITTTSHSISSRR